MHYVHTDHLGSLNIITNQSGAIEQELSYDAWGNRRNPDTWANLTNTPANLLTRRGFTGHEHLDEFGIINMNGRLYDPVLGRFLSPDPIIGDPGNTQSYNRYSYVVNNPLMFTDPSGYRTVPAFQYHSYLDDLGRQGGGGGSGFFWTSGSPHVSDVLGLNDSGSMGYKYLDGIGYIDVATGAGVDYQTAQAYAINSATQHGDFVNRISGDEYRSFIKPKVSPSLINSVINYANAVKNNVDGLQISFGTKDMVICLSVQNDMYNISFTYSAFDNVRLNGAAAGGDGGNWGNVSTFLAGGNAAVILNTDSWLSSAGKFAYNNKLYSAKFYGNQYVSKYAVQSTKALTLSSARVVSRVSTGATILSLGTTYLNYQAGNVSQGRFIVQEAINVIGFFGPWGAAISLGLTAVDAVWGNEIEAWIRN